MRRETLVKENRKEGRKRRHRVRSFISATHLGRSEGKKSIRRKEKELPDYAPQRTDGEKARGNDLSCFIIERPRKLHPKEKMRNEGKAEGGRRLRKRERC